MLTINEYVTTKQPQGYIWCGTIYSIKGDTAECVMIDGDGVFIEKYNLSDIRHYSMKEMADEILEKYGEKDAPADVASMEFYHWIAEKVGTLEKENTAIKNGPKYIIDPDYDDLTSNQLAIIESNDEEVEWLIVLQNRMKEELHIPDDTELRRNEEMIKRFNDNLDYYTPDYAHRHAIKVLEDDLVVVLDRMKAEANMYTWNDLCKKAATQSENSLEVRAKANARKLVLRFVSAINFNLGESYEDLDEVIVDFIGTYGEWYFKKDGTLSNAIPEKLYDLLEDNEIDSDELLK